MNKLTVNKLFTFCNSKNSENIRGICILVDFDQTLTKFNTPTTLNVFDQMLGNDYCNTRKEILSKEISILNSRYSVKNTEKELVELWKRKFQNMIDFNAKLYLFNVLNMFIIREGVKDLFNHCRVKKIPIIINSAGLEKIIEFVLAKNNLLSANVEIFANDFSLDNINDECKILTTLNKGNNFQFKERMKKYNRIILVGDSIHDCLMIKKPIGKEVIKIGLLETDEFIKQYKKKYDLVFTDKINFFELLTNILKGDGV